MEKMSIQNLKVLFQDQPLRDVEQRREFFEVGVTWRNQAVIVILPEMNWCFHCCWRK